MVKVVKCKMGVQFVFSPKWFYGIDCIFEGVSVLVLLLLALSTYKLYKFTKDRHHLYFGVSFIALALGFLAKITTNIEIYFPQVFLKTIGPEVVFSITGVVNSSIIYALGFFFYKLFVVWGFLGLIFIITHSKEYRWIPLTVYFGFIIALFSTVANHIFFITTSILLLYIVYYLYQNWKKKKKNKIVPLLTFLSFLIILVSSITFIFMLFSIYFYVVAEVLQLIGFLVLLVAYVLLIKK